MQREIDLTRTGIVVAPELLLLPEVGTLVDERYRIVRPIAVGGMGAVYEAEQVRVGRRCALKFLRAELAGRSRSEARFRREACILGKLEHEHLTAVLDYGVYLEKSPFLVMEYLDGSTLKSMFAKQGQLALADALRIVLSVAKGMAYVHGKGIVHRDLKPDNLMLVLGSDGAQHVKILDFGVARVVGEASRNVTITGTDLGTIAYMSPEQARGAKTVTASADVFALGTILYEALTGVRPHPGDSYSAIMFHLLTQPHERLARVFSGCPPELEVIVERCLHKDPQRRYQNAGELVEALTAEVIPKYMAATPGRQTTEQTPARAGWRHSFMHWSRAFVPATLFGALLGFALSGWFSEEQHGSNSGSVQSALAAATPCVELVTSECDVPSRALPDQAAPSLDSVVHESEGNLALSIPPLELMQRASSTRPPRQRETSKAPSIARSISEPRPEVPASARPDTELEDARHETDHTETSSFLLNNPYGAH